MTAHHILGPSKMDRITKCIGSLYGPEPDYSSSPAAREGTACHALLEMCLALDMAPIEFLGSTQFSEEFPVTVEMVEAVELFIRETRAVMDECGIPADKIIPERRISHPAISNDLFGGTMDFQAVGSDTLLIADLKFGRRQVYADSKQLTAYSILSMSQLPDGHSVTRVIQLIIQPRGNPQVSRHQVGQQELGELWAEIRKAEAYVLQNPDLTVRAPLEVLDSGTHCKYCPVRVGCPTRDELMVNTDKHVVVETKDAKGDVVLGPAPTNQLSTEMLIKIHEHSDVIKEYLADVERDLKTRAANGIPIPGYKLLMSYGNRSWAEGEEKALRIIGREKGFGLAKKDLFVSKALSVKQVEDKLKANESLKNPELKEKFSKLVESKPIGVRLASSKARGEAVRPETAIEFLKDVKEMIEDE